MNLKLGLLCSSMLVTSICLGVDSRGSGGSAIVCTDASNHLTAEPTDSYEGRVLRGLPVSLGDSTLSVDAKILLALTRLGRLDSARQAIYQERATRFSDSTAWLRGTTLPLIDDTGYIFKPDNCQVKQVVIQRKPAFPTDKKYLVDTDLWDLLSDDNKAVMILHEAIYEEAIERGQLDSIGSRYFNALIFSGAIEEKSPEDYRDDLNRVGLSYYQQIAPFGQREIVMVFHPDRVDYLTARRLCTDRQLEMFSLGGTINNYAVAMPLQSHIIRETGSDESKLWARTEGDLKVFTYSSDYINWSYISAATSELHGVLCFGFEFP